MREDIGIVLDGFYDHFRDSRLAKVERSTARFVQQSIHGGKRLPGIERGGRERAVRRQTVVETPREENGLFRLVDVRKSPPVERHMRMVRQNGGILTNEQADRGVGRGPGGPPPIGLCLFNCDGWTLRSPQ